MKAIKIDSIQLLSAFLTGLICSALFYQFFPDSSPSVLEKAQDWINFEENSQQVLTDNDRAYLASVTPLTKCIDPHWLPLEGLENGKHVGVIAELINSVERALSQPIELIKTDNWVQSIEFLKQGKCDIVTSDVAVGESDYLQTIPFINLHHVYVVRTSEPVEVDFAKIKHKSIGITVGYPTKELLTERYGEINFVEVATVDHGIEMVSKGELFAFADILPVLSYSIGEQGLTNIKVGGHLDLELPTVMAVNSDKQQLVDILDKLFLIADRNISSQLMTKWVRVEYDVKVDWFKWLKIFLLIGALLLLIIVWNRKLSQVNTKLDKSNRELKRLTEEDTLTGLHNRYYFNQVLTPRVVNEVESFSLALLDVDHFKRINDTYGHGVGDRCLQRFAQLIKQSFNQDGDHCVRFGGEEFLIVSEHESQECFYQRLEALRVICEESAVELECGSKVRFTASFGCVAEICVKSRSELEHSVSVADTLLYQAKGNGRNSICVSPVSEGLVVQM